MAEIKARKKIYCDVCNTFISSGMFDMHTVQIEFKLVIKD